MKKHIFPILTFAGIAALILLLVFKQDSAPVYPAPSKKAIEKHIEGKEAEINNFYTTINNEKKIVAAIHGEIADLRKELEIFKAKKDTFQIVQIQDTLINTLTSENKSMRTIINVQDSVITAQRYIINSKDTIIAIGEHKLKKVKNQRNWSLVANGVLLGVLILK
jgi:hypothetical protein